MKNLYLLKKKIQNFLMINVLADQYIYNIRSYLSENINLTLFDPAKGFSPEIDWAHALLVRTVIPVNEHTLPEIPESLQFIGTASAGTDHVDIDYLNKNDITFADAAGCNARSVAEYVAIALLIWAEQRDRNLEKLRVGVIGVGNVGGEVIELLEKLGISTVGYDPPREEQNSNFKSASLEQVLKCDVLSFHTPLTTVGSYPTYHWLDAEKLSTSSFQLVINTARGGVVDEQALLNAFEGGTINDFILDVWENEPELNLRSAEKTFIKTPHIAGYSIQAKENASRLVADALLDYFNIPKPDHSQNHQKHIFAEPLSHFETLSELLVELHSIKKYEAELQNIIDRHFEERGERFNQLRAEFLLRQEFKNIFLPPPYFEKFSVLKKLGFSLIE
ncbi:MAG TPA: NAD(P)-dependent oxidoreductase [Balneolaceae bacterium]